MMRAYKGELAINRGIGYDVHPILFGNARKYTIKRHPMERRPGNDERRIYFHI